MSVATRAAEKLLVTGASGFLGSHVVKLLQEAGYKVRGSVRSLQDQEKVKSLKAMCPLADHPLHLVEADLNDPLCWEEAVKGMKYVIHVASPRTLVGLRKRENELIRPALDGTLNVLKACANSGTVKRVVLTSSCVSVDWSPQSHNLLRDETHWSEITMKQHPYHKSKVLAEKAAWNFVKELPEGQKLELAVINPTMLVGPPLLRSSNSNIVIMQRLLQSKFPVILNINFPLVDIRDAAEAHVKAMITPEAAGHRHLVAGSNMWMSELTTLLKAVFGPQGYSIPRTLDVPRHLLQMAGLISEKTQYVLPITDGSVHLFDNTRMRKVLNMDPRDIRESAIEMVYAMIETGNLAETEKYKGPGGPEEREMYKQLKLSKL